MITSARYRSLLRTVFASIVGSKLSATELKQLVEELRRGRLPDELAYMLDRANKHFILERADSDETDRLAEIERMVKQRKIPKTALVSILRSIGWTSEDQNAGTRSLLEGFMLESSPAKVQKLIDILNSSGASDPYLTGISNSRK